MKNKHGFTLVEILLAVMIVGLIGLSLAAVTTAALRESGVGRTRMVLRNQLSIALRQLRQDIQLADTVAVSDGGYKLTLTFADNKKAGPNTYVLPGKVVYSFTPGVDLAPGYTASNGATLGGTIYRTVDDDTVDVWLSNVKKILDGTDSYPSFELVGNEQHGSPDSRVRLRLIVQANSLPVVNEAIDEMFFTSHGVGVCDPCLSCGTGTCR